VHCRDHAVQLYRRLSDIEDAGAALVFIGQANARQAAHFRRRHSLAPVPVLADADRRSYAAAGAKVATADELLGPAVVAKAAVATARSGVVQGRTVGHPAQLGGVLLVRPDGFVAWARMADNAADNVGPDELLDAIHAAS
jgi:hypothetical protein